MLRRSANQWIHLMAVSGKGRNSFQALPKLNSPFHSAASNAHKLSQIGQNATPNKTQESFIIAVVVSPKLAYKITSP